MIVYFSNLFDLGLLKKPAENRLIYSIAVVSRAEFHICLFFLIMRGSLFGNFICLCVQDWFIVKISRMFSLSTHLFLIAHFQGDNHVRRQIANRSLFHS